MKKIVFVFISIFSFPIYSNSEVCLKLISSVTDGNQAAVLCRGVETWSQSKRTRDCLYSFFKEEATVAQATVLCSGLKAKEKQSIIDCWKETVVKSDIDANQAAILCSKHDYAFFVLEKM